MAEKTKLGKIGFSRKNTKTLIRCPRKPILKKSANLPYVNSIMLTAINNSNFREPPNNIIPQSNDPKRQTPSNTIQCVCLESDLEKMSVNKPVMLKHMQLDDGLTTISNAQFIRDQWTKLKNQSNSAMWPLLKEVQTKDPDDFFVLPLKELCSNCKSSESEEKNIGVYKPFSGVAWNEALPADSPLGHREMKLIKHTIAALLLLHLLGLAHQNIGKSTIVVDDKFVSRLTDWKIQTTVITTVLMSNDWEELAKLISFTWINNSSLHPPMYSKILHQVINLLKMNNNTSEQQALLAWTILSNV